MDTLDVAVMGLGFTGLPTAVAAAQAGFRVVGLDTSAQRVRDIAGAAAGCGLTTTSEGALRALLCSGQLSVREAAMPSADVHMLCEPTPAGIDGGANLAPLLDAVASVAGALRCGDLVVVQSTCPPGTTERVLVLRLVEPSGLTVDSGFQLAYSPIRLQPGNPSSDLRIVPRVVAGATPACTRAAVRFLGSITDELVPVGSIRAAELAKVFENTFRLTNISLVNELASPCRATGIDLDEVLTAAGTKPFDFLPHRPSLGAGGDCVPVSAGFFAATARQHGLASPVVAAVIALNETMPAHTVHLVRQLLATYKMPPLPGRRVLVAGVTYKPNVANIKQSAAMRVLEMRRPEAEVSYHDSDVLSLELCDGTAPRSHPVGPGAADLVLVLIRHTAAGNTSMAGGDVPIIGCSTGTPRLAG